MTGQHVLTTIHKPGPQHQERQAPRCDSVQKGTVLYFMREFPREAAGLSFALLGAHASLYISLGLESIKHLQ